MKYFLLICFTIMAATYVNAQSLTAPDIKQDSISTRQKLPGLFNFQKNYYLRLGAICKWEYQFEKQTKLPLRVRLGSLAYTDHMEQKDGAAR